MLSSASLSDGPARLRGVVQQAVDLAGQIERGQAQTPLCDLFLGIAAGLKSAPFTLTLLGLDADSRGAVLGWLCGEDFHVLTLGVPGTAGLVVVELAERGYVLLKGDRRQEFDRLEPFLEAVRAADLVRQGDADAWLDPMHLEMTAPRGLQGLRLLMPESPAALAQNPALMVWLRARSNLLAVAGSTEGALDAAAVDVIRALTADAPATWAITCGAPPPAGFTASGWTAALGGGTLPSVHLRRDGQDPPPPIPAFLADGQSGVRLGLLACQQTRRFEAAIEMLEERVRGDRRVQDVRRNNLIRRLNTLNDRSKEQALRESTDALRRALGEELNRLRNELVEASRARLLASSASYNKINNFLEDLGEEALAREAGSNVVHLSISPTTLRKAERLIRGLVKADVEADLAPLVLALEILGGKLDTGLAPLGAQAAASALPRLDAVAVAEAAAAAVHLDPKYRGELHEKNGMEKVFELAMHARRPMFLLTMLAPLGIPFVSHIREVAWLMMVILVGGGVLAWKSYRAEQHGQLEREVGRLREALGAEMKRVYEQALREWQNVALRHTEEVAKQAERAVEERLRSWTTDSAAKAARERVEVQDTLRLVENRLRELDALAQQVSRVRAGASEARFGLERATRDALGALRAGAAAVAGAGEAT
jgi:hypothetical protein